MNLISTGLLGEAGTGHDTRHKYGSSKVSELNFTVELELTWQCFIIAILAFIMPEHE